MKKSIRISFGLTMGLLALMTIGVLDVVGVIDQFTKNN